MVGRINITRHTIYSDGKITGRFDGVNPLCSTNGRFSIYCCSLPGT